MPSNTEAEFPLYGGRVCLNLIATLGKRYSSLVERLPDPEAAARWLVVAGVVPDGPLPVVSRRQHERLIELREAAYRLVRAAMSGKTLPGADSALVNDAALGATFAPQLAARRAGKGVTWVARNPFEAALTDLARDAVELVGGPRVSRIKECERAECSRLFVDESQSGRRRWCSMERCGNLAKIAGYRRRVRTLAGG